MGNHQQLSGLCSTLCFGTVGGSCGSRSQASSHWDTTGEQSPYPQVPQSSPAAPSTLSRPWHACQRRQTLPVPWYGARQALSFLLQIQTAPAEQLVGPQ